MTWRVTAATVLLVCATTPPASASTIRVPQDAPTIHSGLALATLGDTVLVARGVYAEHDIQMPDGVALLGNPAQPCSVVIDAGYQGRGICCESVESNTSISGFTVTRGRASGGYPDDCGAALLCRFSSLVVRECRFVDNAAEYAGGAVHCWESDVVLAECVFVGNSAHHGGAIDCRSSVAVLEDCELTGNVATGDGGGLCCVSGADVQLTRCALWGNTAADGGAIYAACSSPTIANCTLFSNSAEVGSGVLCECLSLPQVVQIMDSIIAFGVGAEGVVCGGSAVECALSCCDIYANAAGDWVGSIAAQFGTNGNISEDPLLCLDENPDAPLSLHMGSPCAPGAVPGCELIGAFGVTCAVVDVRPSSWGRIKSSYD